MNSRDYLIELRNESGMSRKEFCEYFEIPYRTLQDWELLMIAESRPDEKDIMTALVMNIISL